MPLQADSLSCAGCARELSGGSVLVDDRGRLFCYRCCRASVPCFGCGAPVSPSPPTTGYVLCAACRQLTVSDNRAGQVFREMRLLLARRLGLRIPGPITLQLLDEADLQRAGRRAAITGGSILGLFRLEQQRLTIAARRDLPLIVLRATLAHELAHAWQAVHCTLPLPTARAEGHAEWVAYHALLALGAGRAAERLCGEQQPYARALAALLRLEARGGSAAVQQLMVEGNAGTLA